MNLSNFTLGINTYPSTQPQSNESTARDVVNLRVDEDGYLRPSPGTTRFRSQSQKVTGIAAAYDHVFYLLEDGDLYYQQSQGAAGGVLVAANTELRGKLSIIQDFETFFLITSTGDDPGYLYDVETERLQILEYDKTETPTFTLNENPMRNSMQIGHTNGYGFFYFFAEVREDDNVPEGSPLSRIHAPLSDALHARYIDTNSPNNTWEVRFTDFQFNNTDTTHIYVYRSPRIDFTGASYEPDLTASDALDFYRIENYFSIGKLTRASHTTFYDDNDISGTQYVDPTDENPTINKWKETSERQAESLAGAQILTGLPEGTQSWRHFNGYNFVAGAGQLRFSEIDFGVLKHASYPAANAINALGDTRFVEVMANTLVFGDQNNFNVLRGYDPFNFQVYRVGSVGPVSAAAMSILPSGALGFIGEEGLYAYDGTQVQKISSPQLDTFFQNKIAKDGFISVLPDNEMLWSVQFLDDSHLTFLLNTERLDAPIWTRITATILQSAAFRPHATHAWSYAGDNHYWEFANDGYWTFDDEEAVLDQLLFVDDTNQITEYLYHNLDSFGSQEWEWESNLLQAGSETNKVIERVLLGGYADNAIDVEVDLHIAGDTVTESFNDIDFSKHRRKKRVPVKRRANNVSFKIAGDSDVLLRSVELQSRVVGKL